tara:strand:+ start:6263 stop:6907 length:645 start_codon:yes stop_codon:yes gene_type:complete
MARIKQRQVLPCVDKQRSAAVKVKASEALTENALIMATGVSGTHMTVNLADVDDFTQSGGTLYVADFAVESGKTVACAVPWKLITGINTESAEAVGQPVYLSSDGTGQYTLTPTASKPHIKVGHVVADHATLGAILLNPGAYSGQIGGQAVMGDGGSAANTATVAVGAAFNGRPVVATMNGGSRYVKKAAIAGGTLTITADDTSTDTVSYMIIG